MKILQCSILLYMISGILLFHKVFKHGKLKNMHVLVIFNKSYYRIYSKNRL